MYPTLAARAIFVIFMQAFGVSTVVRPSDTDEAEMSEWRNSGSNTVCQLDMIYYKFYHALITLKTFDKYCKQSLNTFGSISVMPICPISTVPIYIASPKHLWKTFLVTKHHARNVTA